MIHLFLDIETIPAQQPAIKAQLLAQARSQFKPPASLTKEQAAFELGITDKEVIRYSSKDSLLAQWLCEFQEQAIQQNAHEAWLKTALDGAHGQLCVIGYAIDLQAPIALSTPTLAEEATLLQTFFKQIEQLCQRRPYENLIVIGHNLIEFDLRFLFQRAVILQIQPPTCLPLNVKPWDEHVYDTMQRWGGQRYASLDKLSQACALGGKTMMTGAQVWPAIEAGRIDDVATYCKHDVALTRQLYQRMTFQASLSPTAVPAPAPIHATPTPHQPVIQTD